MLRFWTYFEVELTGFANRLDVECEKGGYQDLVGSSNWKYGVVIYGDEKDWEKPVWGGRVLNVHLK